MYACGADKHWFDMFAHEQVLQDRLVSHEVALCKHVLLMGIHLVNTPQELSGQLRSQLLSSNCPYTSAFGVTCFAQR